MEVISKFVSTAEDNDMSDLKINATIDMHTIEPGYHHPLIFDTFETPGTGEFLLLINNHDPAPLHYQFKTERPEAFDWNYVEQRSEL